MALCRAYSLKNRLDFVRVQKSTCVRGKYVVVCASKSSHESFKLGFTVSKKIGCAVVRNRCKRRLREAVHKLLSASMNGYDYVFIARKQLVDCSWQLLLTDLEKSVRQLV